MMQSDGGEADEGHYFFFSAPASPVHYILRSPPSSTAPAAAADADFCGCHGGAGDFEFFAARADGMSSAEDLFVAGRIRVGGGGLSPVRQAEDQDSGEDEVDGDGLALRARRARSASPPRSPRATAGPEPPHPFASSSSSSSSSSTSSSSAKGTRRRISLRDLLTGTGSGDSAAAEQGADGSSGISRSGFWPPSIWPSRSSKKALLPCPAPLPGRRSTSSDSRAAAAQARKLPPGGSARRTTSLPYRQGLVLGCLGFGARSYGLAKSMHPLYSR